jgi:hypothetical protein
MLTISKQLTSWTWWYIPVILVLRRLRQEDLKFETGLDYRQLIIFSKY